MTERRAPSKRLRLRREGTRVASRRPCDVTFYNLHSHENGKKVLGYVINNERCCRSNGVVAVVAVAVTTSLHPALLRRSFLM